MGFRNMYIAASAGSGKTYQLVNRFIALLSLQMLESGTCDVSRLIAVTFTRKASGEFKERILAALAEAAQSEQTARGFWNTRVLPVICDEHIGICPGVQLHEPTSLQSFFRDMLRELTNDFSRLNLSTIDSFFQQMVTVLGPELGLGSSTTMDDAQRNSSNRRSLDLSYLSAEDEAGASALEEAFRVFCPREQEREAPDTALLKLVKAYHELVLDSPHAQWGGEADEMSDEQLALFGLSRADVTLPMDETAFSAAMETLLRCLAEQQQEDPRTPKNITTYIHSLADTEGSMAPRPSSKKWKSYVERCQQQGVNVEEVANVRRAVYWRGLLSRTAALRRIILEFEKRYHSHVRARGRHVFGDIPRLLLNHADEESVLRMQERTDARLEHWMLDEFQDTSHSQYRVLQDLLTNRVSSDTGSVFMVGDAKQSIYQFRGGDPQIFLDVRQQLMGISEAGGNAESVQMPLDISFRSAAEVLDFSNDLFLDIDRTATQAGESARTRWKKLAYQRHSAAACHADMPGCASIYEVMTDDLNAQEKRERMYDALAALLAQNRPVSAGDTQPSCAILVRRNQDAELICSALTARQTDYGFTGPVVVCHDCRVGSDSPVGLALIQLFRWLHCPADERSLSLLRLSPLWKTLCADFCDAPAAEHGKTRREQSACIWEALKRQLSVEGVSGVLRLLVSRCPALRSNEFMRQRISLWLTAADSFDSKGGQLSEWLTEAEELTLREEPQGNPVRIMTTFQAKGLEYDMVLLPQLNGEAMADYTKAKLLTRQDAQGMLYSVLLPPASAMLEEAETVRTALYEPWLAEQEFAEFCILYVAVTRARHATYVVIPHKSTNGESVTNMMQQVAAAHPECAPQDEEEKDSLPASCLYLRGNRHWHEVWLQQQSAASTAASEETMPEKLVYHFPSLIRSTPSGRASAERERHAATQPQSYGQRSRGTHFGVLVHAAFEHVAWLEPGELPTLPPARDAEEEEAQAAVLRALSVPSVHALFRKPGVPCRLFLEQGIEALRGGRIWVSGQIDRLVVEYEDTACRHPKRAHIIDFKSDRCDAAALKPDYARQMSEYREMVTLALALPPGAVTVTLIHAPRVGSPSLQTYAEGEL